MEYKFDVQSEGIVDTDDQPQDIRPGSGLPSVKYTNIDNFALATPRSEVVSISNLATYLSTTFKENEEYIVRAIFRWITGLHLKIF